MTAAPKGNVYDVLPRIFGGGRMQPTDVAHHGLAQRLAAHQQRMEASADGVPLPPAPVHYDGDPMDEAALAKDIRWRLQVVAAYDGAIARRNAAHAEVIATLEQDRQKFVDACEASKLALRNLLADLGLSADERPMP